MRNTRLPYVGGAISAVLYAYWLERRPLKYHPDIVWPNVAGGIILTGFWVAVRYAVERQPRSLRWAWLVTFKMFWATGVPVVAWEERQRLARALHLLMYERGRHANPAPSAGE
jgi:hypothetical protein